MASEVNVIWHELDAPFFERVLRKHERDESLVVSGVDVENACEVGENFMSVVKRVCAKGSRILEGVKEDMTRYLIVKQVINNKELLNEFPFLKLFENEKNAYCEIIPVLKEYTHDGTLPVPECIYADECTIVLDDLSQEGFINVDKRLGFTIEQAHIILQVLSKLHAASMTMSKQNPDKLLKLSSKIQEVIFSSSTKLVEAQIMNLDMAIRIFESLDDKSARNTFVIEKLIKLKVDVAEKQSIMIKSERPLRVMNHGDTWGNNILLKGDQVKLVDLQIMRYSSVASDLSYFLYINLRPKARRAHMHKLLTTYLDSLNEHVQEMGFDMKDVLTMDWLKGEMDEFALSGFMSALMLMPVFCYNKEDLNMEDANMDDINNMDYQWSKSTPEYKERMAEVVLDFLEIDD